VHQRPAGPENIASYLTSGLGASKWTPAVSGAGGHNGVLGIKRIMRVTGRTQRPDPRTGLFSGHETSTGRFLDDKRGGRRFAFTRVRREN
jgi:hypothetical protein